MTEAGWFGRRWAKTAQSEKFILALLPICFLGIYLYKKSDFEAEEAWKKEVAASKAEQEDRLCKRDPQCWAKKGLASASNVCARQIETLTDFSYRWIDGFTESKFSKYLWKDTSKGIVTYIGNKIEVQNEYGAYRIHTYACDFDLANGKFLSARIVSGRNML